MGVAKDLEATKGELAKAKALLDKSNAEEASKVVDAIEKKLDTIADSYNKKTQQNMTNLKKLSATVEELQKLLDKHPVDTRKAAGVAAAATSAAGAAASAAAAS